MINRPDIEGVCLGAFFNKYYLANIVLGVEEGAYYTNSISFLGEIKNLIDNIIRSINMIKTDLPTIRDIAKKSEAYQKSRLLNPLDMNDMIIDCQRRSIQTVDLLFMAKKNNKLKTELDHFYDIFAKNIEQYIYIVNDLKTSSLREAKAYEHTASVIDATFEDLVQLRDTISRKKRLLEEELVRELAA